MFFIVFQAKIASFDKKEEVIWKNKKKEVLRKRAEKMLFSLFLEEIASFEKEKCVFTIFEAKNCLI